MIKNKKILIGIILVVVGVVIGIIVGINSGNSKLAKYADNTKIGDKTVSYRLDLRIYGTFNRENIRKSVVIDNYKNTDKTVSISGLENLKIVETTYILKNKKYYSVVNNKLKEVKGIPYEDTDIYLNGVRKAKDLSSPTTKKNGDTEYTVYTGKVGKNVINKMLTATDLKSTINKDAKAEIWLTKDDRVYRVYYTIDDLTIFATYFSYDSIKPISLELYK